MRTINDLQKIVDSAVISRNIFDLRKDYRALLIAIDGITPSPSSTASENLLQSAETSTRELLSVTPVTELPQVKQWREAYKAFGAKPKKTQSSIEALTRRVPSGLPRVNTLTDIYNAVSIKHQIPLGGEDLDKYVGAPQLIRASGTEVFETAKEKENPEVGEVVWCDDLGVTCRRWNWRQCVRTALRDDTTAALFILDALAPLTDEQLGQAGDELVDALKSSSPDLRVARRLIDAST